jgi:deoxyribonuclease V
VTDPLDHAWDLSVAEARAVQAALARRVERDDRLDTIRAVAGVDVAYGRGGPLKAAGVVLTFEGLTTLETETVTMDARFPYVPGYLSFREIPAVLALLERLAVRPDLILCDGQGIAHPRRFGLASHLGVVTGLPTIGVAKSRLVGEHGEPGRDRGNWVPLIDKGETIGAVLRTRTGVKPIYVSIGHRVCLETAIRLVLACTPRFRLPETTRAADRLSKF